MLDSIDIAIFNFAKKSFLKLLAAFGIPTGGYIPLVMLLALVYIGVLVMNGKKVKK